VNVDDIVRGIKDEIAKLQEVLVILGSKGGRGVSVKKRKMSAAGRQRIADAQKKRWAKIRAAKKK
jgi:hypothetical protein